MFEENLEWSETGLPIPMWVENERFRRRGIRRAVRRTSGLSVRRNRQSDPSIISSIKGLCRVHLGLGLVVFLKGASNFPISTLSE